MSNATDFKFVVRVHVDIFSKRTNKNPVKGRGLGHATCHKISHSDIGLSPKRVSATDMKFSIAYGCIWIISPKRTNKSPEKGRGLGFVTLIICSINKKALTGAKVTYDSSAYMKAPMAYSTNISSTGNPPLKL